MKQDRTLVKLNSENCYVDPKNPKAVLFFRGYNRDGIPIYNRFSYEDCSDEIKKQIKEGWPEFFI